MPLSTENAPHANAVNSPVAWISLLTFSYPGKEDLRLTDNTVNIISRGEEYQAFPYRFTLPDDDSEKLPTVQLEIDNISGEITEWIRSFTLPPQLKLELITSADFDFVERTVDHLKLGVVSGNSLVVTGTLSVVNILTQKFGDTYDPVQFPSLVGV